MAEKQNTAARVLELASGYVGTTDGAQFVRYYNQIVPSAGLALNSYWCACFVTYIMRQAGVPESEIPNYCSCTAGMNRMKQLGTFKASGSYTPKPGDVILFDWDPQNYNGPDHTGIVEKVSSGTVHTIEGNAGNNGVCLRKSYSLSYSGIVGYGVPTYKNNETEEETMSKADFNTYYNEVNPLYPTAKDVPAYWQTDLKVLFDNGALKGVQDGVLNIRHETLRASIIGMRNSDKRYYEVNELPPSLQPEVQALVDKGKIKGQNGSTLGGMTYSTIRAVVIAARPEDDPEKQAETLEADI